MVCAATELFDGVAVTVTLKVVLPTAFTLVPLLPQPDMPNVAIIRTRPESAARKRTRRRRLRKTAATPARLISGAPCCQGDAGISLAALLAVVPTTSVAVVEPPGVSVTELVFKVQDAFVGAPEQARLMVPLKVALAVKPSVTVPIEPLFRLSVAGVPVNVNAGGSAATVTAEAELEFGLKFASPE